LNLGSKRLSKELKNIYPYSPLLQTELEDRHKDLEFRNTKLNELQSQIEQTQTELQNELNAKNENIEEITSELEQKQIHITELQTEIDKQRQELESRNNELNSLQLEFTKLTNELQTKEQNIKIISYTYTEPTIFYEYMLDIAKIAKKKNYNQVRVSGGEPTIGRKHLITLLENICPEYLFILETNGILLGADKSYVEDLSKFKNLHIRVCFKGCNPKEFSFFTGAKKGFELQMEALKNFRDEKLRFNIALVSMKGDKQELYNRLTEMDLGRIMIEEEEIILYPLVRKRLEKEGILHYFKE